MDRDEITGKAYDLRLMRRLLGYVRPYRRTFLLSLVCLLVSSLALLVQPYLLKIAIDRYMAAKDLAGLSGMAVLFVLAALVELGAFYGNYYLTMLVAQRASPTSAWRCSLTCSGCRWRFSTGTRSGGS